MENEAVETPKYGHEVDLEQDTLDALAEEPKPRRARSKKAEQEPEESEVSQRRRGKMAAGKRPTLREVPIGLIEQAMEHYPQVDLRIHRRSPRGNLAYLGRFLKDTSELLDIEIFLQETLGGGKYRIEPRRTDGGNPEPLVPFEIEIGGDPKVFRASDFDHNGAASQPSSPMTPGAYVDPRQVPPFVRGLPPDQQMSFAKQQGIPVSHMSSPQSPAGPFSTPVATFASDQLAAQQLKETKEELQRERAERERERRESARQQQEANKRLETLEQQWREDKLQAERKEHDFKLEALKAEMARDREQMKMMLDQRSQPQKPTLSGETIAAILTGVAPVVTAFIESSSSRQTKTMEMQTQGVQNLLQATMTKADHKPFVDLLKTVAPIAAPLLTSFWEAKSPAAQADLIATMAENNMTQIGMMTELINQFSQSQGDPPWWLPMVQQSLQGVMSTAEAMMADKRRPAPQQQAQQPAPQQQPQQTPGMAMAQRILSNPACPAWCKNQEWAQALVAIHDQQPVEAVAQYISSLFRRMDEEKRTPPELEKFWDAADEMLVEFLEPLPIWVLNKQYAMDLIERIIQICSSEDEPSAQAQGPGWSATPASSHERPYSIPEPVVSSAPPQSPDQSPPQPVEVSQPSNGVSQRPFVETDAETLDLHAFSEPEKVAG